MSLVGTRPILPDELEQYELHHRARIAIKPGITGMWQVSGRSDITDFEEIVRLDTEYISQWNIGLDIKILFVMTTELIQKYCILEADSLKILRETSEKYGYSARVIHKLLRLARTSADLDGEEKIRRKDIEKVLTCRDLDKSNSKMVVVR